MKRTEKKKPLVILLLAIILLIVSVMWTLYSVSFASITTLLLSAIGVIEVVRKLRLKKENIIKIENKHKVSRFWKHIEYSFYRKQFIHPKIIEDLQGWLSDSGEQVVSINIVDANNSNKYYGEVEVTDEKYPRVTWDNKSESFSYKYIGSSKSGIQILQTWNWTGGTGVFVNLLLLIIEEDEGIEINNKELEKKSRILLTILGCIPLGDRFSGEIRFNGKIIDVIDYSKQTASNIHRLKLKLI